MLLETVRASDLPTALRQVRATLGRDAVVLRTRVPGRNTSGEVEIVAASPEAIMELQRRLDGGLAAGRRAAARTRVGPYTIALVGPPGAGKTTAAIRLALHPRGLGKRRVGLLTLDSYRVGAIDEMHRYAEITELPLEVVYTVREVSGAMARLRDREVVVVDTPGRWGEDAEWVQALLEIDPDEVHLVMPAGLRHDVARGARDRFGATHPTHVLITKLDELAADAGLAELALEMGLPTRWVTEGYDLPGGLASGPARILGALGLGEPEPPVRRVG